MAYGIIKIDTITFTDGGIDKSVAISGLVQNPTFTGSVTVTGTISGNTVRGQTISGVTITGTTAQFTSGTFTSLTGVTVTGTTASFTSGNFTNISGGTHTITSGVFASGTAANPSISFVSDPNSGIYSPGADQVAISTNGTGRLFIDSSGRVGVLNSSPSYVFDVTGQARIAGDFHVSGGSVIDGISQDLFLQGNTGYGIIFRTNGSTERMRLDSSGRLGLGTSSPSANLESQGNVSSTTLFSGFQGLRIQNANGSAFGVSADINLVAGTGSDNRGAAIGAIYDSATSGNHLYFATNGSSVTSNDTLTERLRITAAGNVGIGVTNPTRLFHANDSANEIVARFSSGQSSSWAQFAASGNGTASRVGSPDGSATASLAFMTNDAERARIDSSGRLLVGTSTALSNISIAGTLGAPTFQVQGATGAAAGAVLTRTTAGSAFLTFNAGSSGNNVASGNGIGNIQFNGFDGTNYINGASISAAVDGTPGANDMPGRLVFSTTADGASSPTERMRITSAGNVGIGATDTPAEKLEVRDGNIGLDSAGSTVGDRTTERFYKRTDNGSSNGMAAIGMNGAGTNGFLGEIKFYTGASDVFNASLSERARIDSSGRLLVGTSSALTGTSGYNDGALQVSNSTSGQGGAAGLAAFAWDTGTGPNDAPIVQLNKSASATRGTHTIVGDGNTLGSVVFSGSDGTNFAEAARIEAEVDGTPGANDMPGRLVFSTTADGASSPTERMRITSGGNVGIGTTSPEQLLDCRGSSSDNVAIRVTNNETGVDTYLISTGSAYSNDGVTSGCSFLTGDGDVAIGPFAASKTLQFINNGERARIDSSGRLLVGTSSARSNLFAGTLATNLLLEGTSFAPSAAAFVRNETSGSGSAVVLGRSRGTANGANTVVTADDGLGLISYQGADGTNLVEAARISAAVDGTPGTNDMPGRLVFSTTADGASSTTERMVIKSNGDIRINQNTTSTPGLANTTAGVAIESTNAIFASRASGIALFLNRNNDGATAEFHQSGNVVGTISVTASATAYNTSSDYRLKENIVPLTGAANRLNQLQVKRFNFIADPDKTVDGFIAHEAQAVVPECVTGTKDEVDADGNPVYQGIDQSKIIPLVVAALQEALAEIETLKTRLADAGIN